VYQDIFNTQSILDIAYKLSLVDKQIEAIKNDKEDMGNTKKLFDFLSVAFSCNTLKADMSNIKTQAEHHIIATEMMGHYMPHEKVEDEEVQKLLDAINEFEIYISNLDLAEYHKEAIESFVRCMREALSDLEVGGIKAFEDKVADANGKIILYHEAFKQKDIMEKANDIYKKSTKILNDAQIWGGTLGFLGKFLGY
jgi:hypothetical protein